MVQIHLCLVHLSVFFLRVPLYLVLHTLTHFESIGTYDGVHIDAAALRENNRRVTAAVRRNTPV